MEMIMAAAIAALRTVSLYFAVVAVFALFRYRPRRRRAPAMRFACITAARNEEAVIEDFVKSLVSQDYPRDMFDVFVAVNNCTDRTAEAAEIAGATVINCPAGVRCKGDALKRAVSELLPREYDAFCVFDADNTVDSGFLRAMNNAIRSGARAAMGAVRAKNPYDTWISGCYAIYYTLFNFFFNRPRMKCGLSSRLVGTGFAVHRSVLEEFGGWSTSTVAEDAEFSSECALRGIRVRYVPEAVTYDEVPVSLRLSLRQRRRWCSGVMDTSAKMTPKLVLSLKGSGRGRKLDSLLTLNYPFVSMAGAICTFFDAAIKLGRGDVAQVVFSAVLSWIAVSAVGTALALIGKYRLRRLLPSAVLFPFFMLTWFPVLFLSLCFRSREWKPIPHGLSASGGRTERAGCAP